MALIIRSNVGIEFVNTDLGLSLYFQPGDDADTFRDNLRDYTAAFGDELGKRELWGVYDTLFDLRILGAN